MASRVDPLDESEGPNSSLMALLGRLQSRADEVLEDLWHVVVELDGDELVGPSKRQSLATLGVDEMRNLLCVVNELVQHPERLSAAVELAVGSDIDISAQTMLAAASSPASRS